MTERTLACPGCGHEMRVETLSGVEVDRCTRCYGIWFDMGEVARAALREVPPLQEGKPSPRACPVCREAMTHGRLNEVEVDHCSTCAGMYLDAGGLERLRAGSPDAADPPPTIDDTMEPPASRELRLWALLMGGTGA